MWLIDRARASMRASSLGDPEEIRRTRNDANRNSVDGDGDDDDDDHDVLCLVLPVDQGLGTEIITQRLDKRIIVKG